MYMSESHFSLSADFMCIGTVGGGGQTNTILLYRVKN